MNRPVALIPYMLLAAFVAAGTLWYLGDVRSHGTVQSIPTGETVVLGGPFSLTDQNGVTRTEKDFQGKYMLVFFGYTYCPDVCPTTLAVMSEALKMMGQRAEKIAPLFISIDPKRDTPEKLKSYLDSFGPEFVGLTGNSSDIAQVAKEYRVYYREQTADDKGNYAVDHSGVIYLMDPSGKFIANYSLETSPEMLAADLMKRLR
jgi:protein SCO1